jgi:hypothetical protein
MNTRDLKMNEGIFGLFKGDPKTGKSIAAHSFPNPYTFLFDIGRMKSVKNFYRNRDFEYDTFDDLIAVNHRLEELKAHCPFDTIIYDGMTKFSNLAIECMIDFRNPGLQGKTVRAGIPMTEIEDYGGHDRAITMALNSLLSINLRQKKHVIVIAHVIQTETTDIKTKMVTVTRQLLSAGKKIAAKLPVDFNEAYHFYVNSSMDPLNNEPEFVAVTKSNSVDWASSAMNLPTKITWTNKSFYEEIMKSISGDSFFA